MQALVRDFAREYADEVRTDLHGNVIVARNPGGRPRILLDGHCDHIGLMVQHVDDSGFLYVQAIGGWDLAILLGRAVVVWTQRRTATRRDRQEADASLVRRGQEEDAEDHRPVGRPRRERRPRRSSARCGSATR